MNYCKECETCSGCLKGKKCLFDTPGGAGACIGAVSGQKQPPTPHKHAAVIKAWADGAEVQILSLNGLEWGFIARPSFRTERQYRIKPEPKPDVAMYFQVTRNIRTSVSWVPDSWEAKDLKLTFDGETGALKSAEVLK